MRPCCSAPITTLGERYPRACSPPWRLGDLRPTCRARAAARRSVAGAAVGCTRARRCSPIPPSRIRLQDVRLPHGSWGVAGAQGRARATASSVVRRWHDHVLVGGLLFRPAGRAISHARPRRLRGRHRQLPELARGRHRAELAPPSRPGRDSQAGDGAYAVAAGRACGAPPRQRSARGPCLRTARHVRPWRDHRAELRGPQRRRLGLFGGRAPGQSAEPVAAVGLPLQPRCAPRLASRPRSRTWRAFWSSPARLWTDLLFAPPSSATGAAAG